jgi:hypothetical protein
MQKAVGTKRCAVLEGLGGSAAFLFASFSFPIRDIRATCHASVSRLAVVPRLRDEGWLA